jgi:hypothetical protein
MWPRKRTQKFSKISPSYIGEAVAEKRVGGKRLAGNGLGAERRQFAQAMARFV